MATTPTISDSDAYNTDNQEASRRTLHVDRASTRYRLDLPPPFITDRRPLHHYIHPLRMAVLLFGPFESVDDILRAYTYCHWLSRRIVLNGKRLHSLARANHSPQRLSVCHPAVTTFRPQGRSRFHIAYMGNNQEESERNE